MAVIVRRGESEKTWFRTDRCFRIGVDWFVTTREGRNMGPFKTREAAEQSTGDYILSVKQRKNASIEAKRLSNTDVWSTNNFI